jgi:hypothetical protein
MSQPCPPESRLQLGYDLNREEPRYSTITIIYQNKDIAVEWHTEFATWSADLPDWHALAYDSAKWRSLASSDTFELKFRMCGLDEYDTPSIVGHRDTVEFWSGGQREISPQFTLAKELCVPAFNIIADALQKLEENEDEHPIRAISPC